MSYWLRYSHPKTQLDWNIQDGLVNWQTADADYRLGVHQEPPTRAHAHGLFIGPGLLMAEKLRPKRRHSKSEHSRGPKQSFKASHDLALESHTASLPSHTTDQKQVTGLAQIQEKNVNTKRCCSWKLVTTADLKRYVQICLNI